jgi:hypothetical protein
MKWIEMKYNRNQPNDVVEWLTLLLLVQEVRVQVSIRRPAILTEFFRSFPLSLQASAGIVP